MPAIYNALTVDAETPVGNVKTVLEVEAHRPGGIVAHRCHVVHRRPAARRRGRRHGRSHEDARRPADAGPRVERHGRAHRQRAHARGRGLLSQSTIAAPKFEELSTSTEIFETGIKAIDLLEPYVRGGKTGLFGGAGVGKTVLIQELDQQPRPRPRRHLGLHGRRRAYPRGYRPVRRDERVRRHQEDGHDLRPDERAPGSASARRPRRSDHGRVLPRPGSGRASVHRQHLPLLPGGLRGFGPSRPHALGSRLPAHPGNGDGRPSGAHHFDQDRFDHLGPGRLRPRRRPYGPGAGHDLHPPGRDDDPVPRHLRTSVCTRQSTRSRLRRAPSTR